MTQFEFDQLLEKYLAGNCDPAEEQMVEAWSENQISQAASFSLSVQEEKDINKRLKKRIDASTTKDGWRFPFRLYRLGMAACLFGIIVLAGWLAIRHALVKEGNAGTGLANFELSNTTLSEQEFKLKDGSTITLKPQSRVTYLEDFGIRNRMVYLKGEGYFQIKRDSTKPFYVYAGNLVTKVLGTKFIVKAYGSDNKAEVVVTSGKVMVYENKQGKLSNAVVLTPNQSISYASNLPAPKPQIVDNPIVVNPVEKAEDFVFDKTPLTNVLSRLKKVYGIDVLLKNQTLEASLFTGDLNGLGLYQQLDLICKTIDAHYQKYETAIWIDGDAK